MHSLLSNFPLFSMLNLPVLFFGNDNSIKHAPVFALIFSLVLLLLSAAFAVARFFKLMRGIATGKACWFAKKFT